MGNTYLMKEVEPMPWKGVTVTEQRQRFLADYQLNYCSITELAERFCISRKTAYKWINRFKKSGHSGFHELSRQPHSCPWQTDAAMMADNIQEAREAIAQRNSIES
jgi:transposase